MQGLQTGAGLVTVSPTALHEVAYEFRHDAAVLDHLLRGDLVVACGGFGAKLKVVTGCESCGDDAIVLKAKPYVWRRPEPGEPGIF